MTIDPSSDDDRNAAELAEVVAADDGERMFSDNAQYAGERLDMTGEAGHLVHVARR